MGHMRSTGARVSAAVRELGFGRCLALVVVVGLGARVAYDLVIGVDLVDGFDAVWYQLQAGTISTGLGYIDPVAFYERFEGVPTAQFPPLWPALLAAARLLGLDDRTDYQLVGALLGATTVLLTGLLGRRVAGRAVGLVAALIVALGPMLIAADGSVMSESLYVALVTGVMLASYRALERSTPVRFAAVGVLLGAAALTRADALFLVPFLAVALAWRIPGRSVGRRLALGGALVASMLVVLAPWTAYSSSRMGGFVAVSSNSGSMLEGANCASTYGGSLLGAWDAECPRPRDLAVPELEWAAEARGIGLDYARREPSRLPAVAAARVLRLWGLWSPVEQARLESVETRDEHWQLVGWGYHIVVLALAVPGTVLLVRRRAELTPLLALVAAVVVTAIASYGSQRFALALHPVLAVCAAVAVLAAGRALCGGRSSPGTSAPASTGAAN
ncbi:MAG: glycosyltransferase family 39 protein [Acidimicrobiales bacterium]|jgi:4-amino-4-deoxy-L-arabinose transferase-like glycosyltransferase|nr:glycosyltransferase family 39 protein [Acidimicrobiales bacterium]